MRVDSTSSMRASTTLTRAIACPTTQRWAPRSNCPCARAERFRDMGRFLPGNAVDLLRSGREYFPALLDAITVAEREVWIETYIFADDASGNRVADALIGAARRGVVVRVMVDGWGARHFLTPVLQARLRGGGVRLLKYRSEVAPWQFRSHRMRTAKSTRGG